MRLFLDRVLMIIIFPFVIPIYFLMKYFCYKIFKNPDFKESYTLANLKFEIIDCWDNGLT